MRGIRKRIVAAVLAICLVLSGAAYASAAEIHFSDMSGHWAENYVNALADKGVISGMGDGMFHPDLPVTTSQFVKMIVVYRFGEITPTNDYWASGYLDYASEIGIADYDIQTSDKPLNRQSAAGIAHETLLKILDESDVEDWSAAEQLGDLYACSKCVMHIAQLYVKGIILGRNDGYFHGSDNLTRAEAATIIMRLFDPSLRSHPIADSPLQEAD